MLDYFPPDITNSNSFYLCPRLIIAYSEDRLRDIIGEAKNRVK
jgi:hypothetical protein